MKLKRYIPTYTYQSIFDIDFLALYENKIRLIFMDIDNTMVPYTSNKPTPDSLQLIESLKEMGFMVVFISNNNKERVSTFCEGLDIPCVHFALKPLKRGFKKGLKLVRKIYQPDEVVVIGDQLMTDIVGGNKMGFTTILVSAILKKSDIFSTRINRKRERRIMKKLKRYFPKDYERLKDYVL